MRTKPQNNGGKCRGVATIHARAYLENLKKNISFISLFIYLTYLFIYLFIYLSIYLFIDFLVKSDLYTCKSFLLLLLLFYEKKTV